MPIIMVTAKGEEVDRIVGWKSAPMTTFLNRFNPRELLARIRAVLRRQAKRTARRAVAGRGRYRVR
ncbi:osmolarity response regulator [Salmonella enterica subsp. enterica]|uniref:Osmolarity response regulator n=1 Tax=Salmonella enterica I TaxID=59201 RepID=A0A379WKM2_SALET|nr:osmolarity response regulator [Salmonella enterica subsp. enterica]